MTQNSPFSVPCQPTCFSPALLGPNFLTPTLFRTRGPWPWVGFRPPHPPWCKEERAVNWVPKVSHYLQISTSWRKTERPAEMLQAPGGTHSKFLLGDEYL